MQQYNRLVAKALAELAAGMRFRLQVLSLHDRGQSNETYLPQQYFTAYGSKKWRFAWEAFGAIDDADLVVVSHINLWPMVKLARLAGASAKFVLLTHGIEVWAPLSGPKRVGLAAFDRVVTVSHFTKEQLASQGIDPKKISLVPNAIDPFKLTNPDAIGLQQRLRIDWRSPMLLTVARVAPSEIEKGFYRVMELMPRLLERHPDLQYIIAGPVAPGMAATIKQKADSLGLANRVLLTGQLTDGQLAACFEKAAVFVMPSTKEGFGIVYLEAAMHGLPVVGLRSGGAPEAVPPAPSGWLAEPNQSESLFFAVQAALNEAAKGEAARNERRMSNTERIEHIFSFTALKTNLEQLIRSGRT